MTIKIKRTAQFTSILESIRQLGDLGYDPKVLTQLQELDEYVGDMVDEITEDLEEN